MKRIKSKYVIISLLLIFISCIIFAQEITLLEKYKKQYWYLNKYSPKGRVTFKVKENHEYLFKVVLKNKQYAFIAKGKSPFVFYIIEPSGNKLAGNVSNDNELIVFENIMDKGEYTLEIYSPTINEITMEWGTY